MSTSIFSTVIKNPTAISRTYTFLPDGPVTLAAGATKTIQGDLLARLQSMEFGKAYVDAYVAALNAGTLQVVSTPSPVLKSPAGVTMVVGVANDGSVAATELYPAESSSESSSESESE